ncbi:hypothetical protein G9A89_007316 [Geosiphon pyriformis]|nr:hypothetical protein G9A89_007316 [Geosiphon pyriformis]
MTDFGLIDGYCIKRQESVCEYRLNSYFILKNSYPKLAAGLSFFFAAGSATQHILNIVSEFFWVNNISINTDKTVVIPINYRVSSSSLFISGLSIAIAKKGESYYYLGIFLSTEGLLKPSLAKTQSDVWFFSNLVLRKTISNKQFLYLVLAVLYPIVNYRTHLKLKSSLPFDFPNDSIHHLSFYGLKSFEQIQSEGKIALLINFANSDRTLGHMFSHKSHDLQVLCWHPVYLLSSPVCICISLLNNFLAGVIHVFAKYNLFLSRFLSNLFCSQGGVLMSVVLGKAKFCACFLSLCQYGVAFVNQLCDCYVSDWFSLSVTFLNNMNSSPVSPFISENVGRLISILNSQKFKLVCDQLSCVSAGSLSVYTDGFLRDLGTIQKKADAAVFFENIGFGYKDLWFVAIALALECVLPLSLVCLHSDNQTVLDACKSELYLICLDFCIQCWVKHQHIVNIIYCKNLRVKWIKMKNYSGVIGNNCADAFAAVAFNFDWHLPFHLKIYCFLASGDLVSSNSRHFSSAFLIWHLDLHMAAGFTSKLSAGLHTYFMKALHHQLSVAVWKHLYFKHYPSVLCLFYNDVKVSNHVFSCEIDFSTHCQLLSTYAASWELISGLSCSSSCVSQLLSSCASNVSIFTAIFKDFVFDNWFQEADCGLCVFSQSQFQGLHLVKLSAGIIRLLGIADAFGVHFGFCRLCSFFSGIGNDVLVYIVA